MKLFNQSIVFTLLSGCLSMGVISCQKDIVNYNDGYDDQLTSNGPPVIEKVSTAADLNAGITSAALTDMIVIQGNNLAEMKSIKINDVEVDLATVYAVRSRITLPIPRIVPSTVTNKVTVETAKGSTDFPFEVKIPNLVIEGLYNEFIAAGDTAILVGKYLDLYKLDTLEGKFLLNNTELKPLRSVADSVYFIVPPGTADGATLSFSSPLIEVPKQVKFRDKGISMLDIKSLSAYVTDGKASGDPAILPGFDRFLRVRQSFGAWSWNGIFWSGFDLNDAAILANPKDYYVKFEINTKSTASISQGNFILGGDRQETRYNPAENGALNTYGQWKTMRIDLTEFYKDASQSNGTYLKAGWNAFVFSYQPIVDVDDDFSVCNFRIVKK
mgnify:FL=1